MNSKRCCGDSRTAGDAYLEVATSPFGRPVEEFIWCVPQPIDLASLGASPIGVHLLPPRDVGGRLIYNVIDWIGEEHYPNVSDFIEEGKALGFSRKISGTFDFSKLSEESMVLYVHPRAYVENAQAYWQEEPIAPEILRCLPERHQPREKCPMCSRIWRQDLMPGKGDTAYGGGRGITRTLPCGKNYEGFLRPDTLEPKYQPAIFASFPIGRIAVVKSKDGSHAKKTERARQSSLLVEEVDD